MTSLKELDLINFHSVDEFAIEELSNARTLEKLALNYASGVNIDTRQISAVGSVRSLQVLVLSSSGTLTKDIRPVANLPLLHTLLLGDCSVSPASLNQLALSKSLRRFYLRRTSNSGVNETIEWPKQLEELTINQSAPNSFWNLDKIGECHELRSLAIGQQRLRRAEVEAISECTGLETLSLDDAINEPDLSLLLSLKKLRILTITEGGARRGPEFLKALETLALMPNLENLNCDHQMVVTAEEWSGAKPMASDEVREARQAAWIEKMNEKRVALGLKLLRVTFSINAGPFLIVGGTTSTAEGDEKKEGAALNKEPSAPSIPNPASPK